MKTHLVTMHPFYLLQIAKALGAVGEKGLGGRRVNASVQAIVQPKIEQYDVLHSPLAKVGGRMLAGVEKIRTGLIAKHEGDAERATYDPEWPHLPDPSLSVEIELAPLHLEHVATVFAKWCEMEPALDGMGRSNGAPEHGIDRELVAIDEILSAAKKDGPKDNATTCERAAPKG